MNIIDCESIESAYQSLENITGMEEAQLNLIFDQYKRSELHFEDDSDPLFSHIKNQSKKISVNEVCGFHLTRVPAGTTFEEGLLPSHLVLERFWEILHSVVINYISGDEFKKFKNLFSLSGNELSQHPQRETIKNVQNKIQNRYLGGPYGMVIREIAFHHEKVRNRDFFSIPEFVSDICKAFDQRYELNLTEKYQNNFHRCIVKYRSRLHPDVYFDCLLKYVFYKYKGLDYDDTLQCALNNNGELIDHVDILNIEWVDG